MFNLLCGASFSAASLSLSTTTIIKERNKMPARIASLDDFDGGVFSNENASQNALFGKTAKPLQLCHIPNLPNAKQCRSLLERIYKEFYPIMEKRGYNVCSLSEMCCCGDGLDHNIRKGRRTALKIMGPQVAGYNMTTRGGGRYGKSHSIHLRLRSAQDHSIVLSYEEVAGVMAHEMAHCVHGPHNAAFYKLMDEILDQHAVYMAKGIVADEQGFPIHSSQAYTLGGNSTRNDKSARMQAAQRRQWMPSGPQKLGGSSQFQDLLPPGQAAAQAAYERRLRDEVWCQPCMDDDDVIELSSDGQDEESDEGDCKPAAKQNENEKEEDDDDRKPAAAVSVTTDGSDKENATAEPKMATQIDGSNHVHPKPPPPAAASRPASVVTIDLTTSDDEDDFSTTTTRGRGTKKRRRAESCTNTTTFAEWSCSRCTFRNAAGTLVCGMCGKESRVAQERSQRKVEEICKRDEIQHVKEAEVQESIREFGFNIYGSDKQATAKLPHIT
jgi:hypothetical protein